MIFVYYAADSFHPDAILGEDSMTSCSVTSYELLQNITRGIVDNAKLELRGVSVPRRAYFIYSNTLKSNYIMYVTTSLYEKTMVEDKIVKVTAWAVGI